MSGSAGGVIFAPQAPLGSFNQPVMRFPAPSNVQRFDAPGVASTSGAGTDPTSTPSFQNQPYFLRPAYRFKPQVTLGADEGGPGRRLRKNLANVRRHIDYVPTVLSHLESRLWQRDHRDRPVLEPDLLYSTVGFPSASYKERPIDCVLSKFVRAAMNKVKCPIYDICWTPEGRRLITGASTGEFTLWNGTAFNFETILQAHDTAIRALEWSHNSQWLVSADHDGFIKYWQTNMNNVHMYQAHKEPIRSLSFAPTDVKMATGSDDGTVRIWDFTRCVEERTCRGHGSDVRTVDWHPSKGLVASGSRDSQQPVKLWNPKTGQCLATLHDHKNSVMFVQWNNNGNWLLTGSRDHLIKLFDIRMMKELRTFRGHKKEVTSLAWHPVHEDLFVSGGGDGSLAYWLVNNDKEVGLIEHAHDHAIWTLKWHPLGHILASGSNDNNTKFWTRNRPGDTLEDFFGLTGGSGNLASNQVSVANKGSESAVEKATRVAAESAITIASRTDSIPGMGLEGEVLEQMKEGPPQGGIPGLGGPTLFPENPIPNQQNSQVSGVGAKKTLIKQPPPKKAQRQLERLWNAAKPMGSSGGDVEFSNMDDDSSSNPAPRIKKSLLGPAPTPAPPPTITQEPAPIQPPNPGNPPPQQNPGPDRISQLSGPPNMPQGPSGPPQPPQWPRGIAPPRPPPGPIPDFILNQFMGGPSSGPGNMGRGGPNMGGGPRPNMGGPGLNSGGPRPNMGGPGPNSGGPRPNMGGQGPNRGPGMGTMGIPPLIPNLVMNRSQGSSNNNNNNSNFSGPNAPMQGGPGNSGNMPQKLGPMWQLPGGPGPGHLGPSGHSHPPHPNSGGGMGSDVDFRHSDHPSTSASGGDTDFRGGGWQGNRSNQDEDLRSGPAGGVKRDPRIRPDRSKGEDPRSGASQLDRGSHDGRDPRDPRSRDPRDLRDPRLAAQMMEGGENGDPSNRHVNPKRKWVKEYEAEESGKRPSYGEWNDGESWRDMGGP